MVKLTKAKARAAGSIVDGVLVFMGDEGTRLKRAVVGAVEALGEDGRAALASGDLIGAGLEALKNARKGRKPAAETTEREAPRGELGAGDDDDDDAF